MANYLTCKEVADHLRVKPATVRRWAREGLIPSVRIRKNTLRFDIEAVRKALATPGEVSRGS